MHQLFFIIQNKMKAWNPLNVCKLSIRNIKARDLSLFFTRTKVGIERGELIDLLLFYSTRTEKLISGYCRSDAEWRSRLG